MKHIEVERVRNTRGASLLLFITDRCPVACEHCSVDSRPDGPMIADFDLFKDLLKGICQQKSVDVVGISGGEPFSERRGLTQACQELNTHGKKIVIYTSGIWAKTPSTPEWVNDVLKKCKTVYLSTDTFHQDQVPAEYFKRAAWAIADSNSWIVVQTLEIERTTELLEQTFGTGFSSFAEAVQITPLRNGRGSNVFEMGYPRPGSAMGKCSLAVTPVVRYDGTVTSCCNEEIIMGKGPDRFRSKVQTSLELHNTLTTFKHDPVMKSVAQVGLGQLLMHPKLDQLNKRQYLNSCDLCWNVMQKFPSLPESDRLLHAIAELGETNEQSVRSA